MMLKLCKNCKGYKSYQHIIAGCVMMCGVHIIKRKFDYVLGEQIDYTPSDPHVKNKDGNCPDYTEKISFRKRLRNYIGVK